MGSYAIIEASGKQFWVEEKKIYDLDRISLATGEKFYANNILLVKQGTRLYKGCPYLKTGFTVEGVVLRHFSLPKVHVFKMKPKKNNRKIFGVRRKLTRIFINQIIKV